MEDYLTGNPEMDMQILTRLNLDDLTLACKSNKTLQGICQDDYFWQQKFKMAGIPLFYYMVPKPITFDEYKKFYNIGLDAIDLVNLILLINKVEASRDYFKYNTILLTITSDYKDLINDILPQKVFDADPDGIITLAFDVANQVPDTYLFDILIELNNNQYIVKFQIVNMDTGYLNDISAICTKEEVKTMMMMYQCLEIYGQLVEILDENSVEFILPHDIDLTRYDYVSKQIILQRWGIIDAIKTLYID